ncbi:MAG: M48 family metallopeptidase [Bacteroidetes bacterium]|nr:M48 family metallopeptidase [Bacteroidota bacterium]
MLSKGRLPDEFVKKTTDLIYNDLKNLNSDRQSKKYNEDIITATHYELKDLFFSGYIILNDTISNYLNRLTDLIIKKEPSLNGKVRIYVVRSPELNACCFSNGTVFINMGLIARVKNEAQLAYIICHEFSHYISKHSLKSLVEYSKIDRKRSLRKKLHDKVLLKLRYSKENEIEADTLGYSIYSRLGYDYRQAEYALELLKTANLPFEDLDIKDSFFIGKGFRVREEYFLSKYDTENNYENADDSYLTHPNINTRIEELKKGFSLKNKSSDTTSFFIDEESFLYIRDLCRFECCNLFLVERDYLNAFNWSYLLLKKYPDNKYLKEHFSKGLFGLAMYKSNKLSYDLNSYHRNAIPDYTKISGITQRTNYFFNKIPANELCMISLFDLYKNHKEDKNNLFYLNSMRHIVDAIVDLNNNDAKYVVESVFKEAQVLKLGEGFNQLIEPMILSAKAVENIGIKSFSFSKKDAKKDKPEDLKIEKIILLEPEYEYIKYDPYDFATSLKESDQKKTLLQTRIRYKLEGKKIGISEYSAKNFLSDSIDKFNRNKNFNFLINERIDAETDGDYVVLGTQLVDSIGGETSKEHILFVRVNAVETEITDKLESYLMLYAWGWLVVPIPYFAYRLIVHPKEIEMSVYIVDKENGNIVKYKRWHENKRNLDHRVNRHINSFIKSL